MTGTIDSGENLAMFAWYRRAFGGWKGRVIFALTAMIIIAGATSLWVGYVSPRERRALAFAGTVSASPPECVKERRRFRSVERCSLRVSFEDGSETLLGSHVSAKDLHQHGRPGVRLEKRSGETDVWVDGVRRPWEYAAYSRNCFYLGLLLLPLGIGAFSWRIRRTAT